MALPGVVPQASDMTVVSEIKYDIIPFTEENIPEISHSDDSDCTASGWKHNYINVLIDLVKKHERRLRKIFVRRVTFHGEIHFQEMYSPSSNVLIDGFRMRLVTLRIKTIFENIS